MNFDKPTSSSPSASNPQKKVAKTPILSRLFAYTKSDQDYVPDKTPKKVVPFKTKYSWPRIKAALIIAGSFYILLCAFVLLNPQYALFFNNVLGVQYLTIRLTLEYTIYVVYSILGIFLGGGFLFFGYRAIAIRTKSRAKHVNIWLLTVFFCALFFSNIYLFATTYDWFRKIDFANLDGQVLIYDNQILKYLKPGEELQGARIGSDASIGPMNVRYDLNAYVKKLARLEGFLFSQPYTFEIDYDGDGRPDRGSGNNNNIDLPISNIDYAPVLAPEFAFDTPAVYKPTAKLRGIDVGGNPITLTLDIPAINIQKIVKI